MSARARTLLILVLAGVGLWFTFAVTISFVARRSPAVALAWWSGADAQALAATSILQRRPTASDTARARELAEASLQREPVNARAASALGLIAAMEGQHRRAERLFEYSESLSRRDLSTQLWLIENSVRQNDIESALQHYDHALRVSSASYELLFPVLIRASADPQIAAPLARRMALRPPWWQPFAVQLIASGESPGATYRLLHVLRLDIEEEWERRLLVSGLRKLVDARAYPLALALYRQAGGGGRQFDLVRNGGFEEEDVLPPFDWHLVDEPGLIATKRAGGEQSNALFLSSDQGRSGEIAHQLLLLAPGRYEIRARVGEVPTDAAARPRLSLSCHGAGGDRLLEAIFPLAQAGGTTIRRVVIVPATRCNAQTLSIAAGSSLDQRVESWIDSISVRRI